MFSSAKKSFVQNKAAWKAGLAIVTAGTAFKVVYFNFSRGLMVEHMENSKWLRLCVSLLHTALTPLLH